MSSVPRAPQASIDMERRVSILESRIGINKTTTSKNTQSNNNTSDSINDRLAKIRVNLEGRITSLSVGGTSTGIGSNASSIHDVRSWKEIQKLLRELDPGIALTHQQQPLLYKRQQVLASSDELSRDFAELDIILKLLLTGTKTDGANMSSSSGVTANANSTSSSGDGTSGSSKRAVSGATDASATSKAGQSSASSIDKQKLQQAGKEQGSQQRSDQQRGSTSIRLDQVTQAPILTQNMATTSFHPEEQKRIENLRLKCLDLHGRTTALAQTLRHYLECYHTAAAAVSEKMVLADERISMAASVKNSAT